MNSKKANWLFLSIILTHLGMVVLLMVSSRFFSLNIIGNLILSELIILAPTIWFLVYPGRREREGGGRRESAWGSLRFRRMKPSTALMVVLFTWLTMPLTTFVNMVSMIFVDNTMMAISGQILDVPFPIMLLLMAFYGPFCEEFTFRGAIYGGYRKDGKGFSAVLLSGLLFGLMHMNFNQAAYAFVIGVLLALLVEATGSLWSSVLYHVLFNAQSVCLLFLLKSVSPEALETAQQGTAMTQGDMLLYGLGIYFVLAAAFTTLAVMTLVWMAKNEKRQEEFSEVLPWKRRKETGLKKSLITPPVILAGGVCLIFMILDVV